MNIDIENRQNAALKSYEAHRKLSDKLIQQRLAVPRSFARPKITITPLSQRAQFLNQIITAETIVNYMDNVQDILDRNTEKSYKEKLSMVNELIYEWSKVYDKGIRDKQIPKNFLDDMTKRMNQVLQTFLTGTTLQFKTTKQTKEEADGQITQINKLITDLNRLKEKTTDGVRIMNINDNIRALTKTLLNISQTEIPYPDAEFNNLIWRYAQPLVNTANAIVSKADNRVQQERDEEILLKLEQLRNDKDKIDNEFGEMLQYYNEVKRESGSSNETIKRMVTIANRQNDAIVEMFDKVLNSPNPNALLEKLAAGINIYGNNVADIINVLKTQKPSQPKSQTSRAVLVSEREEAIDRLANILGTSILDIPADNDGRLRFTNNVIPKLSKDVQDAWRKEKASNQVNILKAVKETYVNDPEFKKRIAREGIRLNILQELKQLYDGGSAPAQATAVPTGQPTVFAQGKGPKNNIAFQRAIKQIAQGKVKNYKKGGVSIGPIKSRVTEFMHLPALPEPGIEKAAQGFKKIKELNEPFPLPQKRNFEMISF